MIDFTPLDHPIWAALTTTHQSLARTNGLACRYPTSVSPLAAIGVPTKQAFADLVHLVDPQETVALFMDAPVEIPEGWEVVRPMWFDQMVCTNRPAESSGHRLIVLSEKEVPEMMSLTAATEPGPFRPETIRMGDYFGIRAPDGRLAAMAGIRLQLEGFVEVSAVCTDPDFRGQGFARSLVSSLTTKALAGGRTPFLHVKSDNGAKAMYQKIGFRLRKPIHLTVIRRP